MTSALNVLRTIGRAITWPIRLIREGESDIRETYPDHYKPTGEQVATQASVTMGFIGHGGGGVS
jgi:hypothetical protein